MAEEVRISRHLMFMEIAHTVAKRATCMRLNVGAVLVADRQIVSIGYNGAPSGAPHCAGNECPGKHHCHETIHAEVNAVQHLPGNIDINVDHTPQDDARFSDPVFAVNDAFRRAKRLIKEKSRKQRGEVKNLHERVDRTLDRPPN